MAGITAMGDLSHELESPGESRIDNGGALPDPGAFDVLQASARRAVTHARQRCRRPRRGARHGAALRRIRSLLNPEQLAARPEVPDTPKQPEVPETPKLPEVPDSAAAPARVPDSPHEPEVPDTPQAPELPRIPRAAAVPGDAHDRL